VTLTSILGGLHPLLAPLLLLLGACVVKDGRRAAVQWFNTAALGAAVISALVALVGGVVTPGVVSTAAASYFVAILIAFLGLIIARFSHSYLAGEPGAKRFSVMFQLTLSAVAFTVLTDHLLALFAGWVAISLSLHQLLLFYPERPRAALAAHKKFLFARVAELSVLSAALLLQSVHGTWAISEIVTAYSGDVVLSTREQAAALLLVVAGLIKCAQLPVHGWLIQVVEAPTPVSALLHAGIINLGGYLLILFSPLLSAAVAAQWTLLIVAGSSVMLASLIMTTRISIKVKLAWSTVAQMGMMLVECALGLYELALLHLMAHGLYKAYQFLTAGSEVERYLDGLMSPARKPSVITVGVACLIVIPGIAYLAYWLSPAGPYSPWVVSAAFLVSLIAGRHSALRSAPLWSVAGLGALFLGVYALQKTALAAAVGHSLMAIDPIADAVFVVLFGITTTAWLYLQSSANSGFGRRVHATLFAGLYLDEWVSRITLKLWPMRLPVRERPKRLAELGREVD